MLKRRISFFIVGALALMLELPFSSAHAQTDTIGRDTATITVHTGARQTFMGLGAGQSLWDAQQGYETLPDSVRDSLARFVWGDLNFRYLRLRSTISECGDTANHCAGTVFNSYSRYIQHAKKHQDSLVILLAPHGEIGNDLEAYARKYAYQIKTLRDSGIVVNYTGISNEPDWEDLLTASQVPVLVAALRRQLDSLHLTEVQVVAPENSSADWKAQEFVDAILADTEAKQALGVFATHSYNWSITDEMAEKVQSSVLGGTKQYWQTEASEFGTEKWEDAKQASSALARMMADLNHLCNVWFFYVGIKGVESDWRMGGNQNTAFYMVLFRSAEKDWGYLLKCWYFKQIGQTILPNAVVRRATTNLRQRDSTKYWRAEDSTMVYAFGRKAPLYLAAAVNADGSWGIALTNYTGDVLTTPLTEVFAETIYSVKIRLEEMADSGDIVFNTARCNAVSPYIHDEGSLTMRNGEVMVDSLGSFDMVTLRSEPGVYAFHRPSCLVPDAGARRRRLIVSQNPSTRCVRISFTLDRRPDQALIRARLCAYDPQGRLVAELVRGEFEPGTQSIIWLGDGKESQKLAAGVYLLALETETGFDRARVVISR